MGSRDVAPWDKEEDDDKDDERFVSKGYLMLRMPSDTPSNMTRK